MYYCSLTPISYFVAERILAQSNSARANVVFVLAAPRAFIIYESLVISLSLDTNAKKLNM